MLGISDSSLSPASASAGAGTEGIAWDLALAATLAVRSAICAFWAEMVSCIFASVCCRTSSSFTNSCCEEESWTVGEPGCPVGIDPWGCDTAPLAPTDVGAAEALVRWLPRCRRAVPVEIVLGEPR